MVDCGNCGHFNLPSKKGASPAQLSFGVPLESPKDNGVDREHVRR